MDLLRTRRTIWTGALVACLFPVALGAQGEVPSGPEGGDAQSALEARIAAFNPCEPLGTEIMGVSLGLGEVRSVQVSSADLRLRGDGVSFTIGGRLTCRGAEEDTGGDLAADVSANVEGILSRCKVTTADVTIDEIEGEMSWALDMAAPVIQGLLIAQIEDEVRTICNEFASQ